ncbi:GH1 family beta-glucosidase [Hydrogenibacillus schlegelii]
MAMAAFPRDFLWGVATSAYQIEGAAAEDGRGPSIWDAFVRRPGAVAGGDTGDVACDHYHRWEEDVRWMEILGVNAYRFSVAWPRLFPEGRGPLNERGLAFYARLIERLLQAGITPVVTLYHWDLPLALQEAGGWANRDTAHRFAEYAAAVVRRLGDAVRWWITLNEPWVVTVMGHLTGEHAPGLKDVRLAFRVAHHLNLAHFEADQAIRAETRNARVGLTNLMTKVTPSQNADLDVALATAFERLQNGWFLDPFYFGRYPEEPVTLLSLLPAALWPPEAGDPKAALEAMQAEATRWVRPPDFIGVNYYFPTRIAFRAGGPRGGLDFLDFVEPPGVERTAMGWEVAPDGLIAVLRDLKERYRPERIVITENGAAYDDAPQPDGRIDDPARIRYLEAHVDAVRQAIEGGVPVSGYFYWSLLDNFEWAHGYTKRFGLLYVDYGTQRRTPKASFYAYRDLIAARRGP